MENKTSDPKLIGGEKKKSRHPKRLFVRFGKEKPDHVGFTQDVSFTGIFVKSNFSFPPSIRLKLEWIFPDDSIIQWAKEVPQI
jgi:hypothetical protein